MPTDNTPDYDLVDGPPPDTPGPLTMNLLAVMETPGEWKRISTYASRATAYTVASSLRRRSRKPAPPPGRWEFTSRQVDERFGVWAKYLGPDD